MTQLGDMKRTKSWIKIVSRGTAMVHLKRYMNAVERIQSTVDFIDRELIKRFGKDYFYDYERSRHKKFRVKEEKRIRMVSAQNERLNRIAAIERKYKK
ncbi:hypothetical protein KA005_13750 [bacterium]|nr:hypothetical protein [bacterium]